MENKTSTLKSKKLIKIASLAIASILVIGAAGYGTVQVLRQVKAPTLSDNNSRTQPGSTQEEVFLTPEKAQEIADTAYEEGNKIAAEGDQKTALAQYKIAHENYKIAQNTSRADDTQFIIKAIEAALAVPENPQIPGAGIKSSVKE